MSYTISKSGNITSFVDTVSNVIQNTYTVGPQPYSICQVGTSDVYISFAMPIAPNRTSLTIPASQISSIQGQQPEASIDDLIAQIAAAMPVSSEGLQPGSNTSELTADSLKDSNGNEEIIFTATASAVNELTIANAATGNPPSISATGGDTNISLNLIPKGTGRVQANAVNVVTVSSTDTLTNKTLTSPVINVGSDATGDIYYRNAGGLYTRLPIGTEGQVLTVVSGVPAWVTP